MVWMDMVQVVQADLLRDESFNSITGLNGSGKSNILDAICFVLGITNMSTVRAQNLQARTPFGWSIGITVGRI
jgi:AAA15 family ATPase/GTPase